MNRVFPDYGSKMKIRKILNFIKRYLVLILLAIFTIFIFFIYIPTLILSRDLNESICMIDEYSKFWTGPYIKKDIIDLENKKFQKNKYFFMRNVNIIINPVFPGYVKEKKEGRLERRNEINKINHIKLIGYAIYPFNNPHKYWKKINKSDLLMMIDIEFTDVTLSFNLPFFALLCGSGISIQLLVVAFAIFLLFRVLKRYPRALFKIYK